MISSMVCIKLNRNPQVFTDQIRMFNEAIGPGPIGIGHMGAGPFGPGPSGMVQRVPVQPVGPVA